MILICKNKEITIGENSCEKTDKANISVIFEDLILTNKDSVKLMINKNELTRLTNNTFKIDFSIYSEEESELLVWVRKNNGDIFTFSRIVKIHKYICFSEGRDNRYEQVLLDQNKRMNTLEKRILELEKKNTVI